MNHHSLLPFLCTDYDLFSGNFIDHLKSNGLLKTSPYMLYKNRLIRYDVGGEILEGKDLSTLQGTSWLNDKVNIFSFAE